jgi:PAS domain S-box-containing protein
MLEQNNISQTAEPKVNTVWLPFLMGGLLFAVISLFALVLNQQQKVEQNQTIQSENAKIATFLENDLLNRVSALKRVSQQWDIRGGFSEEEFIAIMQTYMSDMPGFQSIEWVDPENYVRWVVPLSGNEAAVGVNLAKETQRRLSLETARSNGIPVMSAPIDLIQGGKGFLIYFPISHQGKFDGFILAVFRVQDWLKISLASQEMQETKDDLVSAISIDDVAQIYKQAGWDENQASSSEVTVMTSILGHRFTIQSRPAKSFLAKSINYLPLFVALIGFILSLLVGSLVRLNQKATSEAWRTFAAKAALESEIQEHQKTAGELQYTLSRLDMATKAGGIGVWSWHVSSNFLSWNERMFNLFGMPTDIMPVYDTWRNAIHPEDLPATEALLTAAVNGKAVFTTEFRIILLSGEVRYLGAAARVERDFSGRALRVNGINWDLTELKQAEVTLKKSESQVLLLLNSTAEAIYGMDLNGNCTFANPACLRMLGYRDASQMLGQNMHWLIHHSWADGSRMNIEECNIIKALRDGNDVHQDDEVFWRFDRTCFPVEYWSYPQLVNGLATGAVVTFFDITERKKAADLLATERNRLSSILEGTNAGTWEWNIQTGEVIVNERWANIIGYSLNELDPVSIATWEKYTQPDDLKLSTELKQKHFKGELDYYEAEVRMFHKDGFWVWVLDRGKVTSWTSDGKPLLMSGTHQDITHRMVMESTLRQSEAQNLALLSAIPDLIFRIRRDGVILDYKAMSTDLLVIPQSQIIGYTFYDILDEISAAEARTCIERSIESGQIQLMEFSQRLGESTHIYESRFQNISSDEVIAIIRDISERTRLEQMKSDFINRATHELRTPIATMLLMTNLIDGNPEHTDFDEYWGVLIGELNRERVLVEGLLSAGRLESDRYQFNFRPVEITSVVTNTMQQFELTAREKNISISYESLLPVGEPTFSVKADESAMNQVFTNLVGNAIKFNHAGGKVHVRLQRENAGILVSVIDNGMGIPSEDLPMLFNRFFRGSNAVFEEVQGTGIGLFIVRSILEKHAGKITFTTELGKGSQFDVWLPVIN